jgi:hypothetical protein
VTRRALAVALAVLAAIVFDATEADAHYSRSEAQVIDAIRDVVKVPVPVARGYARVIIREGRARHFDPFTVVAMVRYESHWNPRVINASDPRYSVGLGQVGAVMGPKSSCPSKALIKSPGCQARIARLMDGQYNLTRVASGITWRRKWCRKYHGRAPFVGWLSSYQGMDRPRRGKPGERICNMQRDKRGRWRALPVRKTTRRVIEYRRVLIRKYG